MTENKEIAEAPTTAELAGKVIADMAESVRDATGEHDSGLFNLYTLAYDAIADVPADVIGALAVELLVHKGRQAAGSHVRAPKWLEEAGIERPSEKFPRAIPVDDKGTSTYVDFWHSDADQKRMAIGSRASMATGLQVRIANLVEALQDDIARENALEAAPVEAPREIES